MKTIKERNTATIIKKKSIFHVEASSISNKSEVLELLKEVKITYPDAGHYCYAYIIDDEKYASNDGEPKGTAGLPMLNVLEQKKMNLICVIIVRYYGGIPLGAGGLIRAYSGAVRVCLEQSILQELIPGFLIRVTTSYNQNILLDYLLKDYVIIEKIYLESIDLLVEVPEGFLFTLEEKQINYTIIAKKFIKKSP